MNGHGSDPFVQVADLRCSSSKRRANRLRPACIAAAGDNATFLQTICRLLQYGLQVVPPRNDSVSSLSSEGDAGTGLATDCAQGVGNIGFVQPSHEPSSIHPARLLHLLAATLR
jgi:hypothetical protein